MYQTQAPSFESFALDNGLRVQLHHQPRLKRAAAFLRVEAGSHDVPAAWPGLAHFLEHLFFLGTERYPAEKGLMSFVQRHGGQVNASTRERTTDYLFELPPEAFGGAMERLCDMLSRPRMSNAEQLREREVLHAEFIAWSRDAQARHQLWLTSPLAAGHPLRAFHAGNRYSLPVPREAFQQSLREFYRRFYQAGQMTLCVVGPQPLEELRGVVRKAAAVLPAGIHQPQLAPPALLAAGGEPLPPPDPRRFNLVFACEGLPAGCPQALDFLETWLCARQTGGLLAELRRRGLAESLSLTPFYCFGGQAVIDLDIRLTTAGQQATGLIAGLCFDWLEFFQAHDDWQGLREEYALLRRRRLEVGSALDLARHYTQASSTGPGSELSQVALQALRALLSQLRPEHVLHPLEIQALDEQPAKWRLPPRNRFLRPSRRPEYPVANPDAMLYLPGVTPSDHQASVHLRWRVNASSHPGLWRLLDDSLRKLTEEAHQAGVQLVFSSLGEDWQLKLSGIQAPMPALVEQALENLIAPPPQVWRHAGEEPSATPMLPIRELLKRLPEHSLGQYQVRVSDEDLRPLTLHRLWSEARWDGLALGILDNERNALNAALRKMPGAPSQALVKFHPALSGCLWSRVATDSSESALLLFCPTASNEMADDAAWRLLAELCQAPFYQRLRVELQLGYAVFSGFRQVGGRSGLVFGVQSPQTPVAEILQHILAFIGELPTLITTQDLSTVNAQGRALSSRFLLDGMEPALAGETLWQARLAGHGPDYLDRLSRALIGLQPGYLLNAARQLRQAKGGMLCLANGPAPNDTWQPVK